MDFSESLEPRPSVDRERFEALNMQRYLGSADAQMHTDAISRIVKKDNGEVLKKIEKYLPKSKFSEDDTVMMRLGEKQRDIKITYNRDPEEKNSQKRYFEVFKKEGNGLYENLTEGRIPVDVSTDMSQETAVALDEILAETEMKKEEIRSQITRSSY